MRLSIQEIKDSLAYPYIFPLLIFNFFLFVESLHPLAVYAVYPIKAFVVGISILLLLTRLPAIEISAWKGSVFVGAIGFLLWVVGGIDGVKPEEARGFNPYFFGEGSMAWGLIAFRMMGAALVVPVMEEIFLRGFLMRYLIQFDFEKVALGSFRWLSFIVSTGVFALFHGSQWSLAALVGVLYGVWFLRTRTLGDVILAHGVTNFLLGIYILKTGRWYLW